MAITECYPTVSLPPRYAAPVYPSDLGASSIAERFDVTARTAAECARYRRVTVLLLATEP